MRRSPYAQSRIPYEISFSNEDPGWQVSFDGDILVATDNEVVALRFDMEAWDEDGNR